MKKLFIFLFILIIECSSIQHNNPIKLYYLKLYENEENQLMIKTNMKNKSGILISHIILKFEITNDGKKHELLYRLCGNIEKNQFIKINQPIKDFRSIARIKFVSILIIYKNNNIQEIPKYELNI
jgi:hypothetical protein